MRKIFSKVHVGDLVKTTKLFSPLGKDKKPIDLDGDSFSGFIVSVKNNDTYAVRFGLGLDFTNNLNGLLKNNTGCILRRSDFEVISEE